MVKESAPDEIVLDDIMEEGMKNIGKGEAVPVNEEIVVEEPKEEANTNPQFGFKLEPVQAEEEVTERSPKGHRKVTERLPKDH